MAIPISPKGGTPTISIIMPAYNASKTLERSVQAVRAQTHQNWQLIIIDDGSTDNTASLIKTIAQSEPRLLHLTLPQSGVSAARNRGFEQAQGAWIHFLDSDDVIDPHFYARMIDEAAITQADLIVCQSARTDQKGKPTFPATQPFSSSDGRADLAAKPCFPIHAAIVRSTVARKTGGFDAGLKTCEDWDFWIKVVAQGVLCANVPERMAYYYNAEQSLSKNAAQMFKDALTILARQEDGYYGQPIKECGLSADRKAASQTWLFLWCSSIAAAQGQDITAVQRFIPQLAYTPDLHESYVQAVYEGLVIGAGHGPSRIAHVWPQAEPIVRSLFKTLGQTFSHQASKERFLNDLLYCMYQAGAIQSPVLTRNAAYMRFMHLFGSTVPLPSSVDRLYLQVNIGRKTLRISGLPLIRPLSRRALIQLVVNEVLMALHHQLQAQIRSCADRPLKHTLLRSLRKMVSLIFGRRRFSGRSPEIQKIYAAEAASQSAPPQALPEAHPATQSPTSPGHWESVFKHEDPWDYTNAYEQTKYEQTLEIIEGLEINSALELACAEGHFTGQLAPRVRELHATDISETALQRAEKRCGARPNLRFSQLDFMSERIQGTYDLIVCSEVLYYSAGPDQLRPIIDNIEHALVEGGYVLCAHARLLADDPSQTGFDWDHPYGAETIHKAFAACGSLRLVKSVTTELYRIDLFQKSREESAPPAIISKPFGTPLPPSVAASIVWKGASMTRIEACQREHTHHVPVLMYHRIAPSGPALLKPYRVDPDAFERQIRYLRRQGFYSLDPRQMTQNSLCVGRPIILTFDDATMDFYETAWPILQRNGFEALVFVPTEFVGQSAKWDEAYGRPAPVMGWDHIKELSHQGVRFGSHLASHQRATELGTRELLEEAYRSRQILEQQLGKPVLDVAPPFGAAGFRENRILQIAGYEAIYAAGPYALATAGQPFINRLLPDGREDLSHFSRLFGLELAAPDLYDLTDDSFKTIFA